MENVKKSIERDTLKLWQSIDGLDAPVAENDVAYVDIEPVSGVAIHANQRAQINVGMKKGTLR